MMELASQPPLSSRAWTVECEPPAELSWHAQAMEAIFNVSHRDKHLRKNSASSRHCIQQLGMLEFDAAQTLNRSQTDGRRCEETCIRGSCIHNETPAVMTFLPHKKATNKLPGFGHPLNQRSGIQLRHQRTKLLL